MRGAAPYFLMPLLIGLVAGPVLAQPKTSGPRPGNAALLLLLQREIQLIDQEHRARVAMGEIDVAAADAKVKAEAGALIAQPATRERLDTIMKANNQAATKYFQYVAKQIDAPGAHWPPGRTPKDWQAVAHDELRRAVDDYTVAMKAGKDPELILAQSYRPLAWRKGIGKDIKTPFDGAQDRAIVLVNVAFGLQKDFANPTAHGFPLDHCLRFGHDCGCAAATEFCKGEGFDKATSCPTAPKKQTWIWADKRECTNPPDTCQGYASITCFK